MEWAAALVTYGIISATVTSFACVAWVNNDLKVNPLAYMFWPVISIIACIVSVRHMWREG